MAVSDKFAVLCNGDATEGKKIGFGGWFWGCPGMSDTSSLSPAWPGSAWLGQSRPGSARFGPALPGLARLHYAHPRWAQTNSARQSSPELDPNLIWAS